MRSTSISSAYVPRGSVASGIALRTRNEFILGGGD